MLAIAGGSLLLFFALGVPIAFALVLASLVFMVAQPSLPLHTLPERMWGGTDSFPLLAIPFFILAGQLMNSGGITQRLVNLAAAMVGHIRGSLAQVVVVTNMIMAGMSGSAVADAAATGTVLIPAMASKGYGRAFAAAITAAAGSIGPVIPPSISFIIYGSIVNTSIGKLFVAGAIPGIGMGLFLMGASYIVAKRRGYPKDEWQGFGHLGKTFLDASWALMMPAIILVGILGGIVTPTEAAVVAAVYALFVGLVVYREIKVRDIPAILREGLLNTAVISFILAAAAPFAWVLAWEQAPQKTAQLFLSISTNPTVILLLINVLLLIMGCLLEGNAILIILAPVLVPLVVQLGVDPIHFGVIMVINLMIGTLTPPVGVNMFVTCAIAKITVTEFIKEAWVFIVALVLLLLFVTYVPELSMALPRLLMRTP